MAALAGVNIGSKGGGVNPFIIMETTLKNYDFNKYSSGYYYYQLEIDNTVIKTKKMLFIK